MRRVAGAGALLAAVLLVALAPASARGAVFSGTSPVDAADDSGADIDGLKLPDVRTVETSYDDATGGLTVRFRFWTPIDVPTDPGSIGPIPFYDEQFTGGATLGTGAGVPGDWDCPQGDGLRASFTYTASWGGGFPPSWDISASVSGPDYPSQPASVELGSEELVITHSDPALAHRGYACVTQPAIDIDGALPFDFDGFPPTGSLSFAGPPQLDAAEHHPGDAIAASSALTAAGGIASIGGAVITAQPPGADDATGPGQDFSPAAPAQLVADGAQLALDGTLALPDSAPLGDWRVYATWKDALGEWHDGPARTVAVTAAAEPTPTPTPEATPTPSPEPVVTTPVLPRPSPTPTPEPRDELAPAASAVLRGARLSTLRRGAFKVTVLTSEPSAIELRLTRAGVLIARGKATARRAGRKTVELALTRAGKRKLRRLRRGTFTLRVTVTDAAGNARRLSRRVTLR